MSRLGFWRACAPRIISLELPKFTMRIPVDVFPLLTVVCLGPAMALYTSWHTLWTNPDVFPTRSYRQVGVHDEPGDFQAQRQRAEGYHHSLFRVLQEGRHQHALEAGEEFPSTRIF